MLQHVCLAGYVKLLQFYLMELCWHTTNSSNSGANPPLKAKSSHSQTYSQIYLYRSILWSLLDWDGDATHLLGYHTVLGWVQLDLKDYTHHFRINI